jgi:hypothetical protein
LRSSSSPNPGHLLVEQPKPRATCTSISPKATCSSNSPNAGHLLVE